MRNRFRPKSERQERGTSFRIARRLALTRTRQDLREDCSRTDLARFPVETAASVSARYVLRLITRIDNSCAQPSAFGAVFQAVNGCAAHPSPQVLTLRAETCSLFIEITNSPAGWPQRWENKNNGDQFRTDGRPTAQWSRLAAGRSDNLGTRATAPYGSQNQP